MSLWEIKYNLNVKAFCHKQLYFSNKSNLNTYVYCSVKST